jgi:hypothetical protein
LRGGDRPAAISHFQHASGAKTATGKAASSALVRLDLPEHPQRYLKSRLGIDRSGVVVIQLQNPTPVAARNIRIQLGERRRGGGVAVRGEYRLPGTLGPGKMAALRTDIRLTDGGQLNRWESRIVGAVVVE